MRAVEHRFTGPSYTLGVEEELMIVDAETLDLVNSIEAARRSARCRDRGRSQAELMESVCEIATTPCSNTREAGEQLRALRRHVQQAAAQRGLAIGSAGTHPFAMWEDQRIVARPRYRDLIAGLQFVARQELIFGIHVHVGVDDPDKAIHVANGMRVHLPLLLALSAQLAVLARRRDRPALHPHADLPRLPARGHPAALRRLRGLGRAGSSSWSGRRVIEDYTYLWYDVRPHPNFGTVEIRVMDSQTRVEHTLALAALVQAMVKELGEHFEAGKQLSRYPYEMLDENKWLAARHGLDGELVDLPTATACRARARAAAARPPARRTPRTSARPTTSTASRTCSTAATARRASRRLRGQPRPARGHGEIVDATVPEAAEATGESAPGHRHRCAGYSEGTVSQPDLFVVCKNCGSEVSPYVTECPYCGQRVRKRAPKIDRGERASRGRSGARASAKLPRLRAGGDRGDRARHRALRDASA